MIEDLLKKLGFSDKEIQVYLMVLRSGKITPADIARATHINRSTVYSVAKDLIKRGVISEDLGSKHRYLVAISPIVLEQLAQKEEKKLNEKKKTISQVVDELLTVTRNAQYSIPKIHFVSEEDVESYLYSQSKVWNASVQEVDETATWWGFQDKYLIDNYEGWIDWFWENSISHNVSLKLLSNESAEDIKEKISPQGN